MKRLMLYLLIGLLTGAYWWWQSDAARAAEVAALPGYARLSPDAARHQRRRDQRVLALIAAGCGAVWPLFGMATVIGMIRRLRGA